MARKCLHCDALIGCEKGSVHYECAHCRLVDECGIRHYFTTTNIDYEICSGCLKDLRSENKPIAAEQVLHSI